MRVDDDGAEPVLEPGVEGELALRANWPSMFRGYLHDDERYRKCFSNGWYLSGDLAKRDADGYFWFVGRGDDIIKTSGHMVGPFEVESALMEHPAVAEAGVIGKPDPLIGQLVKAFVTLKPSAAPFALAALADFLLERVGRYEIPRALEFREALPRSPAGKLLASVLVAAERAKGKTQEA